MGIYFISFKDFNTTLLTEKLRKANILNKCHNKNSKSFLLLIFLLMVIFPYIETKASMLFGTVTFFFSFWEFLK